MLFYPESSGVVLMEPRADIPLTIYFLLAIVAPTLLPSKLEERESVVIYSPKGFYDNFASTKGPYGSWETHALRVFRIKVAIRGQRLGQNLHRLYFILLSSLASEGARSSGSGL